MCYETQHQDNISRNATCLRDAPSESAKTTRPILAIVLMAECLEITSLVQFLSVPPNDIG